MSTWKNELIAWRDDLVVAAHGLTKLPLTRFVGEHADNGNRAVRAYPLIGLGLGLVGGSLYILLHTFGLPPYLAALASLALMMALTGAFSEDNFRLSALKGDAEDRTQAVGTAILILSLLVQAGALAAIGEPMHVLSAWAAAAAAARAGVPMMAGFLPPSWSEQFKLKAPSPNFDHLFVMSLVGVGIVTTALGLVAGVLCLGLAFGGLYLMAVFLPEKGGDHTGDCLGAARYVLETFFLLAAALLY